MMKGAKKKQPRLSMAEELGAVKEQLLASEEQNLAIAVAAGNMRDDAMKMAASYKERIEALNTELMARGEKISHLQDDVKAKVKLLADHEATSKKRFDELHKEHGLLIRGLRDEKCMALMRADAAERSMSVLKDQMIVLKAHNKEMEDLLLEAAEMEQATMPMVVEVPVTEGKQEA